MKSETEVRYLLNALKKDYVSGMEVRKIALDNNQFLAFEKITRALLPLQAKIEVLIEILQ